jgi:peptidoglycan/xylan/chitin deacetylase (PgdA/CDA1 family)
MSFHNGALPKLVCACGGTKHIRHSLVHLPTRPFRGMSSGLKKLALTFDDGPNDPYTLRLLEVLAKHQIRATFFMVGKYVQRFASVAREVAMNGHEVGNHTFTHPNLFFSSSFQVHVQIEECKRALNDVVGEHSNLFRAPFGFCRRESLRVIGSAGLVPVLWDLDSKDWKSTTSEEIERNVSKRIRSGTVILCHDGDYARIESNRANTIVACDRLITQYKGEGFIFVTIPEMMSMVPDHSNQN